MRFGSFIQNDLKWPRRLFCGIALGLAVGLSTIYAYPQSVLVDTTISGSITDTTNAPIPKASVALEAPDGASLQTITDENGHFRMKPKTGEYILKVKSQGFAAHQEFIHFSDTSPIQKDVVLSVANDGCPVCVTPVGNPTVEPLDASVTSTLPLNPLPPLKLHKRIAR